MIDVILSTAASHEGRVESTGAAVNNVGWSDVAC
jgi:hypothetical protein